jgi:hypothetical protein
VIAGPLSLAEQDEVEGWNEAMILELRERFGANIIEDLRAVSEQRWRERTKGKE